MARHDELLGLTLILVAAMLLPGCGDDSEGPNGPGDPVCSLSAQSLDFGSVAVDGSRDLTFTITNTGGGTLTGTVSGACANFSIVGEAGYSLGAGDVATVTARFAPVAAGARACTLDTGTSHCPDLACAGAGVPHGDYYVHASSGSDANPGALEEPFKTITHAVAAAGPDKTICVLPGTYDAALGEVFPIALEQGQSLLGDVPNKGSGPTPTTVYGSGYAGPAWWGDCPAVLVAADGSSIAGLSIGAPYAASTYGIYAVDVTVTISDNTFTSATTNLYGGVYASGDGASAIARNDFLTYSYGLYSYYCTGAMVVEDNLFQTMALPVDVLGALNNTVIRGNTFIGNGQSGVQVQHGVPSIENNVFNKPGGYSTNGAVSCQSSNAAPKVRGNAFMCARGVSTEYGNPDLGTSGEPGGNDFSGVTGAAVYHAGAASISAIGNTWASSPPVCGTEIVTTGGGAVTWGTGPSETCP
jgi:hypothetical protein